MDQAETRKGRDGTIEIYVDGELILSGPQSGNFELLAADFTTERGHRYRLEKIPPAWVWWWRR